MRGDEPIDKSMRRKLHKLHGKLRKTVHNMGNKPKSQALEKKISMSEIKERSRAKHPDRKRSDTSKWPSATPGREAGMKAQMGRTGENRAFQAKTHRAWND